MQTFVIYTTDINDCKDEPCKNGGTCLDGDKNYTCMCEAGWNGKDCETSKLRIKCRPFSQF